MKKIASAVIIIVLPVLFLGCGKKRITEEKGTEQTAQQENNVAVQENQEVAESTEVPLPQEEDIVRLFFSLINEKRIPEAVGMLDSSAVPNDSAREAWGVQFNIFDTVIVKSIEPSSIEDETEGQKTYEVILDVKIKPGSENAAIPNYGWENGKNIRWVSLKKDGNGMWKILTIGTGP